MLARGCAFVYTHRVKPLAIAALAPVLCACVSARLHVVRQASFDHNCPEDRVEVLEEDTASSAYRLKVCGAERRYRDRGENTVQFIDVTDERKPAPAAAAPAQAPR